MKQKYTKKTYDVSVYETIKLLNPLWLSEVENKIANKIDEIIKQLKEEAEYEGQPEMFDDSFLYERYKENADTGMYNGNWQVLKYFYRKMKIKIYELMRGKWLFTDQDVEMYNYFLNLKVSDDIKCKPAQLKIKSSIETSDLIYDNQNYFVYYEFKTQSNIRINNVGTIPYFMYFSDEFYALEDLIRNAKMQQKNGWNVKLFSTKKSIIPNSYKYGLFENKEILRISTEKIENAINKDYIDPYKSQENVMNLFKSYLDEDEIYNSLNKKLKARIKEIYDKFVKTDTYEVLADIEKEQIKNFILKLTDNEKENTI